MLYNIHNDCPDWTAALIQPIRTCRGLKLTGIFSDLIKRQKYVNAHGTQCVSLALKAPALSLALDMLIVKRSGCSPLLSNWKMTLIKAHVANMRTLSGWSQCCNLLLSSLSLFLIDIKGKMSKTSSLHINSVGSFSSSEGSRGIFERS